jgi:hypothetical protein
MKTEIEDVMFQESVGEAMAYLRKTDWVKIGYQVRRWTDGASLDLSLMSFFFLFYYYILYDIIIGILLVMLYYYWLEYSSMMTCKSSQQGSRLGHTVGSSVLTG